MNKQRLSNLLVGTTAGLFVVTGLLHLSGLGQINTFARGVASADVQVLLPMLWVGFGLNIIAAGIMVGLVALENSSGGRYVLAASALVPWTGALLQVIYVGGAALWPMLLLVVDGTAALAAAYYREARRRRSAG